jgi:hypothetical protein
METPVARGVLKVGIDDAREVIVMDVGAPEKATAVTAAAGDDDTAAVVPGFEGVDNMVD